MLECWNSDPNKRPTAIVIKEILYSMWKVECNIRTEIIKSLDIGPITINNPGAIYSSRPLSGMIKSAISIISLRSQSITIKLGKYL